MLLGQVAPMLGPVALETSMAVIFLGTGKCVPHTLVTSVDHGKDGVVGWGVEKVVRFGWRRLGGGGKFIILAFNNGGQLDAFARLTGLATSPWLPTRMASPLISTNRRRLANAMATHLICPSLPLVHLCHHFLLTVHLRFFSWVGNVITMGAPRVVGHTLCRALQ